MTLHQRNVVAPQRAGALSIGRRRLVGRAGRRRRTLADRDTQALRRTDLDEPIDWHLRGPFRGLIQLIVAPLIHALVVIRARTFVQNPRRVAANSARLLEPASSGERAHEGGFEAALLSCGCGVKALAIDPYLDGGRVDRSRDVVDPCGEAVALAMTGKRGGRIDVGDLNALVGGDLLSDFDFNQSPRAPLILPAEPPPGPASVP